MWLEVPAQGPTGHGPYRAYGHRMSHSGGGLVSLMLDCRFRNKAAAPETKGALKEVPHPAAYVPNGYVLIMASPGAATHTMESPKLEKKRALI